MCASAEWIVLPYPVPYALLESTSQEGTSQEGTPQERGGDETVTGEIVEE